MVDENEIEKFIPELVSALQLMAKIGVASESDLVERAVEEFEDEFEAGDWEPRAQKLAKAVMNAQLVQERTWPQETDCDKLDKIFDRLTKEKILAKQNYWCCTTCALSAINGDIEKSAAENKPVQGYVYYHEQDAERAAESGELLLGYGSVSDREADTLAIAKKVVDAVKAQKLAVQWNGTVTERILVKLDWKRRRLEKKKSFLETFLRK